MPFLTFYTWHPAIGGYRGTWTIHYTKAHKKHFWTRAAAPVLWTFNINYFQLQGKIYREIR